MLVTPFLFCRGKLRVNFRIMLFIETTCADLRAHIRQLNNMEFQPR